MEIKFMMQIIFDLLMYHLNTIVSIVNISKNLGYFIMH